MRNRLTAKTLLAESQADGLFPGDIGNMERKKFYRRIDEYNNEASELKEGWDTTDKTDTWSESNKRGPANVGIMKTAAQYRTAKKAITMAEMFLGEKAPEEQIKAQAKEFMALGYRGICASIRRWAATDPECVENDETCKADVCPECGEDPCTCEAETPEVSTENADAPAAEPTEIENTAPAAEPTEIENTAPAEEPTEIENTDAPAENGEAPEMIIDLPEVQEDMPADLGDGTMNDVEADPELQALFSDEDTAEKEAPAEKPVAKCTSKQVKAGIKHLAAQPKLTASTKSSLSELQGCWDGLKVNL